MADWSFEWSVKESLKILSTGLTPQGVSDLYQYYLSDKPDQPKSYTTPWANSAFGHALEVSAVPLIGKHNDAVNAWTALHLAWRMKALAVCGKLELQQAILEAPSGDPLRKRFRIRKLDSFDLINVEKLIASADILGIEDGKDYFVQKLKHIVANIDEYSGKGQLEWPYIPLLFNVIMQDIGSQELLPIPRTKNDHLLPDFWDAWLKPEQATQQMTAILNLIARMIRKWSQSVRGEIIGLKQHAVPFEILYIQRVRGRLGLSNCLPDHPLLDSPLATVPQQIIPSGYNAEIQFALDEDDELLGLKAKMLWEARFQALPETRTLSFPEMASAGGFEPTKKEKKPKVIKSVVEPEASPPHVEEVPTSNESRGPLTIDDAKIFVAVVSDNNQQLVEALTQAAADPTNFFKQNSDEFPDWEPFIGTDPMSLAIFILHAKEFIGLVDWRGRDGEIEEEVARLLETRDDSLDDFMPDMDDDDDDDYEQSADKTLNAIASNIKQHGLLLCQIAIPNDEFNFLLLSQTQWEQLRHISSPDFEIRKEFR